MQIEEPGGLGILDIKRFGCALRLRWKWLEWKSRDRPWVSLTIPYDKDDIGLFDISTNICIGNGSRACFLHDRWLDGQAPKSLAPDIFCLCYRKNFSVAQSINNQNWFSEFAPYILCRWVHGICCSLEIVVTKHPCP